MAKKKAKVKLDLRGKDITEKVQFARQIVTNMTANSTTFANPNPALASITTAAADLEKAYNDAQTARDVAKTKTGVQADKEEAMDLILGQIANFVENASKGDPTIIKSAGLDVKGETVSAAAKSSGKPSGLSATAGDKDGEVDLHWDTVAGAKTYMIQYCKDPISNDGWVHGDVSTKSKVTLKGLEGSKKYWFRVAAVTSSGQGAWSDAVVKVVQ